MDEATEDLELHPYVDSNVRSAVARYDYDATKGAAAFVSDEDAEEPNATLGLMKNTSACIVRLVVFLDLVSLVISLFFVYIYRLLQSSSHRLTTRLQVVLSLTIA